MTRHIIEVLFTPGCPYIAFAIERVRLAARGRETDIEIRLVRVEPCTDASGGRLPGLPTIRVDGVRLDDWSIENALSAGENGGRKAAPFGPSAAAAATVASLAPG